MAFSSRIALLAAVLSPLPLTLAQSCTEDPVFNNPPIYNASGSINIPTPEINNISTSDTFTFSSIIVAQIGSDNDTIIDNGFTISANPAVNTSDPDFPYTGCFLGLLNPSSEPSSSDDGTCSSTLSLLCRNTIASTLEEQINLYLAPSQNHSTSEICQSLASNLDLLVDTTDCKNAWGGAAFSAPIWPSNVADEASTPNCSQVTLDGVNASAVVSWEVGIDPPGTYEFYDEAVRYGRPLISAFWLRNATGAGKAGFLGSNIMCFAANTTVPGSRTLADAEEDKSASGHSGAERFGVERMLTAAVVGWAIVFAWII